MDETVQYVDGYEIVVPVPTPVRHDSCGRCGRPIVEDGYPVRGETWHLECALTLDPNA